MRATVMVEVCVCVMRETARAANGKREKRARERGQCGQ
jgi:hypothetical protein